MQIENHFGTYKILSRDTTSLFTVDEVKIALGYGTYADSIADPQIQSLIDYIPHMVERILNIYIYPITGKAMFYNFSNFRYYFNDPLNKKGSIILYKGNITSISSIKYLKDNVLTTVDANNYYADCSNKCKVEILARKDCFPIDYDLLDFNARTNQPNTVEVYFSGGYDINNIMPESLRRIMLELIMYFFSNSPACGSEENCVMPNFANAQLMTMMCPLLPLL